MNADDRPGFWKRLLLFIVRFVVIGVIVLVLATGGYLAVIELQRSLDSIATRIAINRRDLEELSSQVDMLSVGAPEQQRDIAALEGKSDQLDQQLDEMMSEISGDLERQKQLLATLDERIGAVGERSETAIASSQTANEDTAALGTALVALQADLNDTNSRVDALGGEIDELRAGNEGLGEDLSNLNQSVISAQEVVSNVVSMEQTLALFHVWELITRARLRLDEDNLGLASDDVESAFRVVDGLMARAAEADANRLELVRTRLALTFTNLPDDPSSAAIDLEGAWDELEEILSERILPPLGGEG